MTLAAGGRAHTCVDRQSGVKGPATERNNSTCLSFLTSAIGSVVSHSPTAYRQLVEICTQVSYQLIQKTAYDNNCTMSGICEILSNTNITIYYITISIMFDTFV